MNTLVSVFMQVVAISWQAAWLIPLLVVLRLILRRHAAPALLFAGWLLMAGVLLIPLRLPVPWNTAELGKTTKAWLAPAASLVKPGEAHGPEAVLVPVYPIIPPDSPRVAPPTQRYETIRFTVLGVRVITTREFLYPIALVWMSGVACLLLLRVMASLRLRYKLARTRLPAEPPIVQAVETGCAALGIARRPRVTVTSLVGTPALCGLFRPQLLFPVGFVGRHTEDDLRWVVLHELKHLQRRDLWALALLQGVAILHWFNPAVWLAVRLARHDCELACDEAVLRHAHATNGLAYGNTLLSVLSRVTNPSRLPAAVGIVEGKRQLTKRLTRIAAFAPGRLRPWIIGTTLLIVLSGVGFTKDSAGKRPAAPPPSPVSAPAAAPLGLPMAGSSQVPRRTPEQEAESRRNAEERRQWEETVPVVLRGIGAPGGIPVAMLHLGDNPIMVVENSRVVGRRTVAKIDPVASRVIITQPDLPDTVLELSDPHPVVFPDYSEEQVEQIVSENRVMSRDWYNRFTRDMSTARANSTSLADQEAHLLNFLSRGLVVAYFTRPGGGGGGHVSQLFSRRINERRLQAKAAFAASLDEEQRAVFDDTVQMAIRFTAPPEERERQVAAANERRAAQAAVVAELTPAQRALYDDWQTWVSQ